MTMKRNTEQRGRAATDEYADRVINIGRVAKVVKGGRRFSFTALVVVGDGAGKVGWGHGKANEVPEAIRKASERARRDMVQVPLRNGTLPHTIIGKFGAASVVLKPAAPGTGVIAGGAVRPILEVAGYKNVLTKIINSRNPHNVVRATFEGLSRLITADEAASRRGISSARVLGLE